MVYIVKKRIEVQSPNETFGHEECLELQGALALPIAWSRQQPVGIQTLKMRRLEMAAQL
jgi:hypothetical protein